MSDLPDPQQRDHLSIKIGQWVEASATGRLAVVAVVLLILVALVFLGWNRY